MPGAGTILKVLRMAATRIPWGTVIQNSPMLVDVVERARERFRMGGAGSHDVYDQLRLLQEENMKLAESLVQSNEHLQEVTTMLEVVVARQRTLAIVSIVALLLAVCSLGLWIAK